MNHPASDLGFGAWRLAVRSPAGSSGGAAGRRWGRRPPARQLLWVPHDFVPGDAAAGERLLAKGLAFGDVGQGAPVAALDANAHAFNWLRDLRAQGTANAVLEAQRLVGTWLDDQTGYDAAAWTAPLSSQRVANWITHLSWFGRGASDELRDGLFESLMRQVNRLARTARSYGRGGARVRAAKGLVFAAACVPGCGRRMNRALGLIERELTQHLLDDSGCHERSPEVQFQLLRDLVEIRSVLSGTMMEVPASVERAIARMAPLVRLTRHADGGLAQFNGGGAGAPAAVEAILRATPAVADVPTSAPDWGFQRLEANGTTAIVEGGAPPEPGFDAGAHAGTLSFEMCVGDNRLIVNVGASGASGPDWREAARATAAHSTLVLADTNSSEVVAGRGLGRKPRTVDAERVRAQGVSWIDLSHDGYADRHHLVHHRRLSLTPGGQGLFGEDQLTPGRRGRTRRAKPYAIRFHLHPSVSVGDIASDPEKGAGVLLNLPDGDVWRLSAEGAGAIELEDSVYLGGGAPRAAVQVVLRGETGDDGGAHVMWSLIRHSPAAGPGAESG